MFGFQRTGDAQWAAGDQMARGFIIGATAGRTTLTGEGLQHADGHSHLLASTNPATVSYDPAYGYEIAHIVRSGIERMYGGNHPDPNVMYYLTVYNEPLVQPAEPEDVDVDGIVRGIHRISTAEGDGPRAQILASGVGVPWALEAQQLLRDDWGVQADVWSVTSWTELRRDGLAADEHNFLHPTDEPRTAYVTEKLRDAAGPVVAVSDFMHAVQDQIRPWVPNRFATLGRRRLRLLRHPCRGTPLLQDRRTVDRGADAARLAEDGVVDREPRGTGDREVPPARRDRRHQRQRGRRELTRGCRRSARRWTRPRRSPGCGASRATSPRPPSSGSKRRCPGTPRCRRRGGRRSGWWRRRASPRSSSGTTTRTRRRGSRRTSSPRRRESCCAASACTQTLQLIRVTVEITEERVAGKGEHLREAILLYSREVAFAAADVYARAAEARGLWDARLEALVVDSILTGEADEELPSRIAALGWHGHGEVAVLVGTTPPLFDVDQLRRTARKLGVDVLIGVQGSRLVLVLGRAEPPPRTDDMPSDLPFPEIAKRLEPGFGTGHLVLGPTVPALVDASQSARAALAGFAVARAWRHAPRPVEADDLLPERALAGDPLAKQTLVERIYRPLQAHSADLVTTLWSYLDNGRSLEATARELFVHPNTVRYRLKRVSEVIGWDATGPREALILQTALILGSIGHGCDPATAARHAANLALTCTGRTKACGILVTRSPEALARSLAGWKSDHRRLPRAGLPVPRLPLPLARPRRRRRPPRRLLRVGRVSISSPPGTEWDADRIRDTQVAQPLIVAASLLSWNALRRPRRRRRRRRTLGRRVRRRRGGRHPERRGRPATRRHPRTCDGRGRGAAEQTGMSAVIGGDEAAVVARLDELDLTPANYNGGGQLVAAGALDALRGAGGRAARRHPRHPAAGGGRLPHPLHGARRRDAAVRGGGR